MKKLFIVVLLFVGLLIPAVSADEVIIDEIIDSYVETGGVYSVNYHTGAGISSKINNILWIDDITKYPHFGYLVVEFEGDFVPSLPDGRSEFTYNFNGADRPGYVYKATETNLLGAVIKTKLTLFLDNWDIGTLTGTQKITLPFIVDKRDSALFLPASNPPMVLVDRMSETGSKVYVGINKYTLVAGDYYQNKITITETTNPAGYLVQLNRTPYNTPYTSTISISLDNEVVLSNTAHGTQFESWFPAEALDLVEVIFGSGMSYPYTLGDSSSPSSPTVTIYVRNSQTGALIANSHIDISAFVNGEFHEDVNETLPGGIYTGNLQPTGGGLPNPDYYRLTVTAEGYNDIMPYHDFEVDEAITLYVFMEPVAGAPEDENMTFVEFYVRDIYANPLSNADVSCGGYTLKTNSAGYTQFELPKNAVYSYSVSKIGYMTIEGIATVEGDGRYTVNVALMAGVVPTQTVVTPTITVEPTPTQTSPIQEDNIIGMSVKGLAKGFGIEYDTALLLFGLMIIFGAGGMVMSSVKGGAMEFIAGSIVGTFVAFALGLIPIWIFIIIAVVFGAYVLRVFVQGSQ